MCIRDSLSEDNEWLMGLTQHMEYITAQAYQEYGGEAANNPYWTKINGGARADGSKYLPTSLTNDTQMEILSAWYGKTVYVRVQGESGPGKAIEIPAYTGVDYQLSLIHISDDDSTRHKRSFRKVGQCTRFY